MHNKMHAELINIVKEYADHPEFIGVSILDVNQHGALDATLLHLAVRVGNLDHVKAFIRHGARVNEVGDMGFTPLHDAAQSGRVEIAGVLLAAGANPRLLNEWKQSAIDLANETGNIELARLLMR